MCARVYLCQIEVRTKRQEQTSTVVNVCTINIGASEYSRPFNQYYTRYPRMVVVLPDTVTVLHQVFMEQIKVTQYTAPVHMSRAYCTYKTRFVCTRAHCTVYLIVHTCTYPHTLYFGVSMSYQPPDEYSTTNLIGRSTCICRLHPTNRLMVYEIQYLPTFIVLSPQLCYF